MLFSLAVIFLCGMLLGGLCKKLKLPPLLGMLLTGASLPSRPIFAALRSSSS